MSDIRCYNGVPYKRFTGVLTKKQALAKARRVRGQSMVGKILARVDTYQNGYAVWKRDKRSAWAKKNRKC